jgi:hypothetical protein
MSILNYFSPATGSPFTPTNVTGTTITISSTTGLSSGMSVENASAGINTTISSITNSTQFVVASATGITTSTPLNIGNWLPIVLGAQGAQGVQGAQGAQGAQGSTPSTYVSTFAGGTTGLTPASATSGAISLAGTLAVANGGTGLTTLGTAGQVLTVNAGATALQYSTPSGGSSTPDASTGSLPPSYYYTNVSYQSIDPFLIMTYAASGNTPYFNPGRQYVYFQGVYLPSGVTINYLTFYSQTATSAATMYMGIYNSTTRLAVTAAITTAFQTAQVVSTPFAASYTVPTTGYYWIALLIGNGSTTAPRMNGSSFTSD